MARSGVGYVSRLAAKDAPVVEAMRELAGQYPRCGYRMVMPFLARQKHVMGADRACASGARLACKSRDGGRAAARPPADRDPCRRAT